MLSCFRSIIHQTSRFRPALTATPTASFSISLARGNNPKPSEPYRGMFRAIGEEASKQEEEASMIEGGKAMPISTLFAQDRHSSYRSKKEYIRIFRRNRALHPTEFSRDRRVHSRVRTPRPWDLGPSKKVARHYDIFHQWDIDPVDECMNATLLGDYVTRMGRIKKRAETRLTMKNQRRISKAIKRAKMMGILPIHHHAPLGLLQFPK